MRALICDEYGPPELLKIKEVEDPKIGPNDILIKIKATGINFPDGLIIQNLYQIKPNLPFSPGSEVAGIIEKIGNEVKDFKIGDRVIAMTTYGGLAAKIAVSSSRAIILPDDIDFNIGASLLMAYGTSLHALKQRAQLQNGETILVLGAGGGVSLAAIDLAHSMGANVIAAASSQEKLNAAKEHGANNLIDYSKGEWRTILKESFGNNGFDVVFDPIGGNYAEPAFRMLQRNGRYLVIGFASGEIPSIPFNLPLLKSAAIVGVFWGAFTIAENETHKKNMNEIFEKLRKGKINPLISKVFSFEESANAIKWVMDRKAIGKIIVNMES